ncbi:MAG: Uma2 family endonuclease [Deltaproteobacteria bacterium]|nr:Uma2 family endonuclease [Deltaproteobacteria bacterium]
MAEPKRRATYEDLMQVPEWKVAEIIEGELIVSPRPATPHAYTGTVMIADLGGPFGGPPGAPGRPGGWWVLYEPELHFGEDVLVPDVAAWRRERFPQLPNAAFISQAPDWVCEVISPSTGTIDRGRKMRIYAREGVGHLWFVEPLARTLEVYRLDDEGHWVVVENFGGDDVVRAAPFDAIALDLARWWLPGTEPTR